ncbi:hypothetical protein BH11ARM1_BH11ARM1_10210 [soil metagenome]
MQNWVVRRFLGWCLFLISAMVAMASGFLLIGYDLQVFFGLLFVDGPDPSHPGRMKGVMVTPQTLLFHIGMFVASLFLAVVIGRRLLRRKLKQ